MPGQPRGDVSAEQRSSGADQQLHDMQRGAGMKRRSQLIGRRPREIDLGRRIKNDWKGEDVCSDDVRNTAEQYAFD